jgi:hypothetical protein
MGMWQLRVGLFFMLAAFVVAALPAFQAKPVKTAAAVVPVTKTAPPVVVALAPVAKPERAPAPVRAKPAKRRGTRH